MAAYEAFVCRAKDKGVCPRCKRLLKDQDLILWYSSNWKIGDCGILCCEHCDPQAIQEQEKEDATK